MANNSIYIRTVIEYCRDFCSDAAEIVEIGNDNPAMADLIDSIIMDDIFTEQEILKILPYMKKHVKVIMALYTRYPESAFLDKMYNRSLNLRQMCESIIME